MRSDQDELKRLESILSTLKANMKHQQKHVAAHRETFEETKASLFPEASSTKRAASTFLSNCIFPRCMQGPDDAMYCARFILLLHESGTPGFGTLDLLDILFTCMPRSLFGLTEGEAANVSILFVELWKQVIRWRYDEGLYEREVASKSGAKMAKGDEGECSTVSLDDFTVLFNKWHASIGFTALGCLQSSDYMHMRNSLIVLSRMVDVYPSRPGIGNKLLKALVPLQDEEKNSFADIRAAAQSYGMQLLKARDEGVWREETEAAVQARQAKEQAAAEARQKKAEAQMEEIKREAAMITEELGEWDRGRGRGGRDQARGRPDDNRSPRPDDSRNRTEDRRGGASRGRPDEDRGGRPEEGRGGRTEEGRGRPEAGRDNRMDEGRGRPDEGRGNRMEDRRGRPDHDRGNRGEESRGRGDEGRTRPGPESRGEGRGRDDDNRRGNRQDDRRGGRRPHEEPRGEASARGEPQRGDKADVAPPRGKRSRQGSPEPGEAAEENPSRKRPRTDGRGRRRRT